VINHHLEISERDKAIIDNICNEITDKENLDIKRQLLYSAITLLRDHNDRLDLKLASAAVTEMANAFAMFAPFKEVRKVTIFGSARVSQGTPLYEKTKELAHTFAEAGWMVVTGAGPGIMAAGSEGAGTNMAIGVNIRLPFENYPNTWVAAGEKLVEMKYFFTRKLMLMKESSGFLVLPGGFGTLDECFELLTLVQTGKAEPNPIVLVEPDESNYWHAWENFVQQQVYNRQFADVDDSSLYLITEDIDQARSEVLNFYSNYHSRRFINDILVIRLQKAPSEQRCAELSEQFSDITGGEAIRKIEPSKFEIHDNDHLSLDRIGLKFNKLHQGRLRQLINELNKETL
jgi:hypothetical protein